MNTNTTTATFEVAEYPSDRTFYDYVRELWGKRELVYQGWLESCEAAKHHFADLGIETIDEEELFELVDGTEAVDYHRPAVALWRIGTIPFSGVFDLSDVDFTPHGIDKALQEIAADVLHDQLVEYCRGRLDGEPAAPIKHPKNYQVKHVNGLPDLLEHWQRVIVQEIADGADWIEDALYGDTFSDDTAHNFATAAVFYADFLESNQSAEYYMDVMGELAFDDGYLIFEEEAPATLSDDPEGACRLVLDAAMFELSDELYAFTKQQVEGK